MWKKLHRANTKTIKYYQSEKHTENLEKILVLKSNLRCHQMEVHWDKTNILQK